MNKFRNIDNEIEELEQKIQELKAEKARFQNMSDNQILAEALHSAQCHWNHTDGCGWYYESWENPGYSKKEYLEKANNMLSEIPFEQAMRIVKFM